MGADIVPEIFGDIGMRAGAINYGLDNFMSEYDYILAMDADSTCAPDMIEQGAKSLEDDPSLGAVCSRAGVLPQPELKTFEQKILWHIQNIEYGEYDSSRVETTGAIKVAHGLATLFRKKALDEQKSRYGYVYCIESLCEDYWLTMDLKELGWGITSCQKMRAWTIVPTTFKWLWKQRTRWNLGGVDTIVWHGLNRITFWDIFAHVATCGLIVIESIILIVAVGLFVMGARMYLSWLFWTVFILVWMNGMYRMRYCQNPDKWDFVLRVSALPMELYYYFLQATLINGYLQYLKGVKRSY